MTGREAILAVLGTKLCDALTCPARVPREVDLCVSHSLEAHVAGQMLANEIEWWLSVQTTETD